MLVMLLLSLMCFNKKKKTFTSQSSSFVIHSMRCFVVLAFMYIYNDCNDSNVDYSRPSTTNICIVLVDCMHFKGPTLKGIKNM